MMLNEVDIVYLSNLTSTKVKSVNHWTWSPCMTYNDRSLIDRSSACCCQPPSLPKWGNLLPPKRDTSPGARPAAGKSKLPTVREEPPGHIQGVPPHGQCEDQWYGPVWIHLYRYVDIEFVHSVFMMMRKKWRIILIKFSWEHRSLYKTYVYLKQLYIHVINSLYHWNIIFNFARQRVLSVCWYNFIKPEIHSAPLLIRSVLTVSMYIQNWSLLTLQGFWLVDENFL